MRLVVDATALTDLEDISAWIAKDSPQAARQIVSRIFQTINQLRHFPRLSRSGRARDTRERVVSGTPYIIVFQLWEDRATMVIVAIAHGARRR